LNLKLVLVCLAVCLTACLPSDQKSEEAEVDSAQQAVTEQISSAPAILNPEILKNRTFTEAPMFAEMVGRDELPPVSERLPENPLVVVPYSEIGQYGGDLRRALTGDIVQTPGVSKTLGENLMGFERPISKGILLNLAESYTYEDEGRSAVFTIRSGIKWSDGTPFTVDDILFWYQDMTLDDDARSGTAIPSSWYVNGKPIVAEKVDDLRIRFRGERPLGRILSTLSSDLVAMPKHYFAKFHPRYNPEVTYETCRDSTTNAMRLYRPGTPVLSAWMPVEWSRGQRLVFERNPYYFKIDSAGNQLPYVDRLIFNIIQDQQVILLKFVNGEIDLIGRYAQINMYPTLKAAERKGKIRVLLGTPMPESHLRLNWDVPRPELREAIRDRRVRLALSYAINREEISQILYHGLMTPASHSFGPASVFYSEEAAKRHAIFDPERSRQLLDEAGYRDSNGDGVREFIDGSDFSVTMNVTPGIGVDVCQLVIDYWNDIGIQIHLNVGLRDIIFPMWNNGEFEFFWWGGWSEDAIARPQDWGAIGDNRPTWHRNAATEGPDWMKESTRLIMETHETTDPGVLNRNMARVRELHTHHVPTIITGFAYRVWGANHRVGNIPITVTSSDGYRGWSRPIFHEQLYIKQGQ
jgi:peptide/nickel transport system substrate-binding protein